MRNFYFFTSLLFLSIFSIPFDSHAQSWQWSITGGSTKASAVAPVPPPPYIDNGGNIHDMGTDTSGNVYFISPIEGEGRTVAGVTLPSDTNKMNMLLTSLDCKGVHRWSKIISNHSTATGNHKNLRVSKTGYVYVWSNVLPNKATKVDNDTTLPASAQTLYLLCYDYDGNFKWIVRPQPDTVTTASSSAYLGSDFDIDSAGNAYLLVSFPEDSKIAGSTITIPHDRPELMIRYNTHILKYNTKGELVYAKRLNAGFNRKSVNDYMRLKFNPTDNGFYLSGPIQSSGDSIRVDGKVISRGFYIVAFDPGGASKWIFNQLYGKSYAPLLMDKDKFIYISGTVQNGTYIDIHRMTNPFIATGSAMQLPFVAKLNPTGKVLWASNGGIITTNSNLSIVNQAFAIGEDRLALAVNKSYGDVYFGNPGSSFVMPPRFTTTPITEGDGFIVELDLFAGTTMRMDMIYDPSNYKNEITSFQYFKHQLYAGGRFNRTIIFDKSPFRIADTTDIAKFYVAKYGDECTCDLPDADFNYSKDTFAYSGLNATDSVVWDYGDGNKGKGDTTMHKYLSNGSYKVCAIAFNKCGSDTICKTINISVSVKEARYFAEAKLYPNPANDHIIIDGLQEPVTIQMFNMLGQNLYAVNTDKASVRLPFENCVMGIYTIILTNKDGQKQVFKVQKNND